MNEEQVWLEEARRGDKTAFGQLIEAYQGPVYNLAYRMLGEMSGAEDIVQDAWLRWQREDAGAIRDPRA